MILPTKHVSIQRSLLGVGADILKALDTPTTVGSLWNSLRDRRTVESNEFVLDYRWFVLALDLLYAIGAVELERGILRKVNA